MTDGDATYKGLEVKYAASKVTCARKWRIIGGVFRIVQTYGRVRQEPAVVSLLRRRAGSGDLILCSQRRQPRVATTARRAVFALFRLGRRHDFSVRRPPVLMQATSGIHARPGAEDFPHCQWVASLTDREQ